MSLCVCVLFCYHENPFYVLQTAPVVVYILQYHTDFLSVLVWVQSLCKGFQEMTTVAARKKSASYEITLIIARTTVAQW